VGTYKYHIQVSHHLRVGKNALNEYDQYAIYLAILNHGTIDMFSVCSRSNSMQFVSSAAVPYLLSLVKYQLSYSRIHACGRKLHTSDR